MHWKKVTLIGVGLLGGSLGLALRQRRLAGKVVGFVRRAASIRECQKAGVVDEATCDLGKAVEGAELIVFSTPLAQIRGLLEKMLPCIEDGALMTDVGSVKASVVRDLERLASSAGARFVGSHPMAGAEKTGVKAANASLFQNAVCVVTPTGRSHPAAVRAIRALWKALGTRVIEMSPQRHDELVSFSSHLPHVLAAGLTNLVLAPRHPREQALLCANGFRDTTRIASGSPEMWQDIMLANGANVTGALDHLITGLKTFRSALKRKDQPAIRSFFEEAKLRRDRWRDLKRF